MLRGRLRGRRRGLRLGRPRRDSESVSVRFQIEKRRRVERVRVDRARRGVERGVAPVGILRAEVRVRGGERRRVASGERRQSLRRGAERVLAAKRLLRRRRSLRLRRRQLRVRRRRRRLRLRRARRVGRAAREVGRLRERTAARRTPLGRPALALPLGEERALLLRPDGRSERSGSVRIRIRADAGSRSAAAAAAAAAAPRQDVDAAHPAPARGVRAHLCGLPRAPALRAECLVDANRALAPPRADRAVGVDDDPPRGRRPGRVASRRLLRRGLERATSNHRSLTPAAAAA